MTAEWQIWCNSLFSREYTCEPWAGDLKKASAHQIKKCLDVGVLFFLLLFIDCTVAIRQDQISLPIWAPLKTPPNACNKWLPILFKYFSIPEAVAGDNLPDRWQAARVVRAQRDEKHKRDTARETNHTLTQDTTLLKPTQFNVRNAAIGRTKLDELPKY